LAPTDKSAEKEVKGRLPRYFGQIGLSKKQEEEMRKVAQPFDERISQLRKQINEFEKQIDDHESAKIAACEKLLTEAQKAALKERRDPAELERANRKKPSGKSSPEGSESREK
jgi:cell division protein ZapA (FtsZ GTPase activity inhibitor)